MWKKHRFKREVASVARIPKVICDTAHNKEGLNFVMKQLQEEVFNKLHIVLGVVSDKDLDAVLPLFPKKATIIFVNQIFLEL